MKKTIDIRERIAVRAYYAWLNGSTAGTAADWAEAEQIELAYAERRSAAALKAAATRRANGGYDKMVVFEPEMLAASRKPTARRPTAH